MYKVTVAMKRKGDIILACLLKSQSRKHQNTKGNSKAYSELKKLREENFHIYLLSGYMKMR